jgi:hypothetical protein
MKKGNKAQAKLDNHATARSARNAIAKSLLDISELNIACQGGAIELWGKVRPPRGHNGVINMRKEFDNLQTMITNVRGVREIQANRVVLLEH